MIVKGIRTGTYVAEALSGKRAGLCPNLLEKLPVSLGFLIRFGLESGS